MKGDIVEQLVELRLSEQVSVDHDRLVELCVSLGEAQAEEMITVSISQLWRGLEALRDVYQSGDLDKVAYTACEMSEIATGLGLHHFSKVASDVATCASRFDEAALGACLSRLNRVADGSINSVWDSCGTTG